MSAPTLALTFNDMILRVAEYLGVADYSGGAAAIPTDAHDLDVCKRMVNDGWRRFVNSNPKWNWLTPLSSVVFDPTGLGSQCVASDPSRYYLADGWYGHLVNYWTYDSTGPRVQIGIVDEAVIRQMYAASGTVTGNPRLAAHRPLAAASGGFSKRWEVIFYPTPSAAFTVSVRARLYADKLTGLTDVTIAGFQFDEAVLLAGLAEAERQRNDKSGVQEQQFADALKRAIGIDMESQPRKLGYNGDFSDSIHGSRRRPTSYGQVDTYTNLDGTVHSF